MSTSAGGNEARDEHVIELYNQNVKLEEITRQTRVPRATIYLILETHGIRPNRNRLAGTRGETLTIDSVLSELRTTERENGRLREQLDKRDMVLSYLMEFLTMSPEKLDRLTVFFDRLGGPDVIIDTTTKTSKRAAKAGPASEPARPMRKES